MGEKSNRNGRAFEYACLKALFEAIQAQRAVETVSNKNLNDCEKAWGTLTKAEQILFQCSAKAALPIIFSLEPRILEESPTPIRLLIQPDTRGQYADARDIIIQREEIQWEIGFSVKHNSLSVKHSRLSPSIDFSKDWFGFPCSSNYWNAVIPIFDMLSDYKRQQVHFSNLDKKNENVYKPILNAFTDEIKLQFQHHENLPKKLVQYILSRYDFYRLITIESKRITEVQPFNLFGTLNRPAANQTAKISIPTLPMPQQLLYIGPKPQSNCALLICLDQGWQFTFRLHSAATLVEPSLKFDIRIAGVPSEATIKYILPF